MNEDLIPFLTESDPDYYMPASFDSWMWDSDPNRVMEWLEEQTKHVPRLYNDMEVWGVHDLDDYQDLISRFIHYYANKELPTDEGLPYASEAKQDLS
jgi:hypothetical protein